MKITKQELHEIIREETTNVLNARQTKVVDEQGSEHTSGRHSLDQMTKYYYDRECMEQHGMECDEWFKKQREEEVALKAAARKAAEQQLQRTKTRSQGRRMTRRNEEVKNENNKNTT